MSSSLPWLFGNVSKTGKLENDEVLDREFIDSLERGQEYLDAILGTSSILDGGASSSTTSSLSFRDLTAGAGAIQPIQSATDFSEINELAEDEGASMLPPPPAAVISIQATGGVRSSGGALKLDEDDNYDDDSLSDEDTHLPEETNSIAANSSSSISSSQNTAAAIQLAATLVVPDQQQQQQSKLTIDDLPKLFPHFKAGGLLKFTDLFSAKVAAPLVFKPEKRMGKQTIKDFGYLVERDERKVFLSDIGGKPVPTSTASSSLLSAEKNTIDLGAPLPKAAFDSSADSKLPPASSSMLNPMILDCWETRVAWDLTISGPAADCEKEIVPAKPPNYNKEIDVAKWEYAYEWDDENVVAFVAAKESKPLLQSIIALKKDDVIPTSSSVKPSRASNRLFSDRFNISDDNFYEISKNARSGRVRQTYGPTKLVHSLPAIKLLPQYFKVHIPTKELRSSHRPSAKFPINVNIEFSKVKNNNKKNKKMKGKDATEYMRSINDISLKDTSKFLLFEYSEEYPPIMMNSGMATLIHNYYRKREEKDPYVPVMEYGVPFILEQFDASPFYGLGDLSRGTYLQAIYNNMFSAPIFKHDILNTDFLLIRRTFEGQTKYYLRDIPAIYTIGQTYPMLEIPRPQSRKVTSTLKARMQVVAYRLAKVDPARRQRVDKLLKRLPGFSESQIRLRLREIAQFQRKSDGNGWWKLKPNLKIPSEDALRKMLTPEMACLYESMCVGEQWLRDSGYSANLDFDEDNEDEEMKEGTDIEVQLAPWVITRNFLQAAAGKGMLKLYGAGDPTGIGEGFSFVRASMKEMFYKSNENAEERMAQDRAKYYHKFSIAEQQHAYREEINRIWVAQLKALNSSEDIIYDEADDDASGNVSGAGNAAEKQVDDDRMDTSEVLLSRRDTMMQGMQSSPPPMSPAAPGHGNYGDNFSDAEPDDVSISGSISSRTSYRLSGKNRVLVINRLVRDEDLSLVWKSEIITDSRVMNAYLRQRTLIERRESSRSSSPPSMDDAEEKRRIRQRTRDQLDRLKQNRKGKEKLVLNLTSSGDGGGNVAVGVSSSTVSSKFKISIKSET